LPYRGKSSILIELHYEVWPQNFEVLLFRLQLKGLQPVIAHPERYRALFRRSDLLASALNRGAVALLDLMSLVGRYGESCQRAAERMLEEGLYDAACSDAHRPSDVEHVARGIERLRILVGREAAERLLGENPRRIAQGNYERDE
ncbi:MAG: protein tyrosine phosphatase, partial [Sandaracinaceae bacterium]|nr:protein tyrosine phosphatase [Sandaracinaceae bacterium]